MDQKYPMISLPQPLRGLERGTFTHRSIVDRLPEIGHRLLEENEFSSEVEALIQGLLDEIPGGPIRRLGDQAPDAFQWSNYVRPYAGGDWFNPPWFFVENYFYRRLLEATGYFSSGAGRGADPFSSQKIRGLSARTQSAADLGGLVLGSFDRQGWQDEDLAWLLAADLWSNQADLSMWPDGSGDERGGAASEERQQRTIIDDRTTLIKILQEVEGQDVRIDILVDNAGFELVVDLILAVFLLKKDIAKTLLLHTKVHPTFVSDATTSDIWKTVLFLAGSSERDIHRIGNWLLSYLNEGRLMTAAHPFWTSPLPAWEMPESLKDRLSEARLVISKGDAHYRRLLGDRHWSYDTPIEQILSYLPAPLVALRTLKSEVVAGIEPAELKRVKRLDADWLINGQWGIIQLIDRDR